MNNPYVKTLEPVWSACDNVRIYEEKLQELIEDMKLKKKSGELIIPAWDVPNVQPPMDCSLEEWIDFVCMTNTVNFSFTNFQPPYNKFVVEYPEGTEWRGAFAMEASFTRAKKEGIPIFDANYLRMISSKEAEHVFRSVDQDHQIPLLWERWIILHEIGEILLENFGGSWLNLFKRAGWRAFNSGKGIVEQLVDNFPSFHDARRYKGRYLEFHKRAQLLVMMYHGRAFNSRGKFPLVADIRDIGPICDYELPKVLHSPEVEVLEYSPQMEALIGLRHVFKRGEPMETENRLLTAYALKRICDEVEINMAQADYYLWNRGRKSNSPHILVPTIDY